MNERRAELKTYIVGFVLSAILTLAAFAMVMRGGMSKTVILWTIGVLALAKMAVQLRCFLHIGFRQKREDLQLILFSSMLMLIMVAGTIWIMSSLYSRM